MNQVKQAEALFEEYEAAKTLLAKWQASDARGTPTEIDLRDEKLAHAQQNFDAAEAKLRTLRGDYGDGAQTALPSSAPVTNSPAPLTTGSPSKAKRRTLLSPLIDAAQAACPDPYNTPSVWSKLREMAVAKTAPFIGATDEGLQWIDENDQPKYLSLKNLRDRLRRMQKSAIQAR